MIKITLIHPSRGRPQLAFKMAQEWYSKCDTPSEVEYLIGLDSDDPTVDAYRKLWVDVPKFGWTMFSVNDTRTTVQVENHLAKLSNPKSWLIVTTSDDMGCPEHWDTELLKVVSDIDCLAEKVCIGVDDGIHNMNRFLMVIETRAYYNSLGYILYPEYRFARADDDWMWSVLSRNIMRITPHLVFPHRHWTQGKNEVDDIYKRIINDEEMAYGWEVYQRRQADNFGINK